MKWRRGHVSDDVIDRRGQSAGGGRMAGAGMGGLIRLLPLLLRWKYGWLVALAVAGFYVFGGALSPSGSSTDRAVGHEATAGGGEIDDAQVQFVSFVLDDAQNTWKELFRRRGRTYENAKLVLFTDRTSSGCGYGSAATGPFYCPADRRVYIDLGFYAELAQRFGAPGDFAQAYVIAHEIGHHVQNLIGDSEKVRRAPASAQRGDGGLSVRLELQADCYAGVWGHATQRRDVLEAGDVEEGLTAAAAIGDDRLQRSAGGLVQPEAWTHGSSEQRVRWFRRGLESGDTEACDTFAAASL